MPGCATSPSIFTRTVDTRCSSRLTAARSKPACSAGFPKHWKNSTPMTAAFQSWSNFNTKETNMPNDNIFSGLKVVDLASFIAGPSAAVILSDFGADVIKVEPPSGDLWRFVYKVPPQPHARDNYLWHLNNRNKRGMAVDLKS